MLGFGAHLSKGFALVLLCVCVSVVGVKLLCGLQVFLCGWLGLEPELECLLRCLLDRESPLDDLNFEILLKVLRNFGCQSFVHL